MSSHPAPGQPSPCVRHACHACCLDTRMTLTEADVARLRAAGEEHFFLAAPDGSWQLRNVNRRCVFLTADGRCSVYERRPEGCALYPLVLDLAAGRVVRDPFCPHRLEFPAPAAARRRLRRSVAREEREAQARRLARGPR